MLPASTSGRHQRLRWVVRRRPKTPRSFSWAHLPEGLLGVAPPLPREQTSAGRTSAGPSISLVGRSTLLLTLVRRRDHPRSNKACERALVHPASFADTWVTTPWIAGGPKGPCAVPVVTRVMFENWTCDPPLRQTWSVDAPLDSKGAGLPFPEVMAVVVTTTPEPVVGGLLAGQTVVS